MEITQELISFVTNQGVGVLVALILLYDKIKTNGAMKIVIENNNQILREIKEKLKC